MKMLKIIFFRIGAKDGRDIPVYFRKGYKKARVMRKSERWSPGFWENFVAGKFFEEAEEGEQE